MSLTNKAENDILTTEIGGDRMETYERIKDLRKNKLKVTQDVFAAKINISRSNLGNIETGKVGVTDRVLVDICKAYGINREWLEHGTGEMYDANALSVIDQLVKRYKLSDTARKVLETYIGLEENDKQVIDRFVRKIVESHQANQPINLKESMVYTVKVAARGGEPPHTEEMTQAEAERIANLPRVPDDL